MSCFAEHVVKTQCQPHGTNSGAGAAWPQRFFSRVCFPLSPLRFTAFSVISWETTSGDERALLSLSQRVNRPSTIVVNRPVFSQYCAPPRLSAHQPRGLLREKRRPLLPPSPRAPHVTPLPVQPHGKKHRLCTSQSD